MSQSLVKNLIHLVYSTKHRKPWIPEDVRDGLFAFQAGIFKQWESPALIIGGVEDHVHALFSLSKNHALKKLVEEVKKGSSKWMKRNDGTGNKDFQWQAGYAGFSVSLSNVEEVRKYIENRQNNIAQCRSRTSCACCSNATALNSMNDMCGISRMPPFVSPFQGYRVESIPYPGRRSAADAASLCPGLICFGPFGAEDCSGD